MSNFKLVLVDDEEIVLMGITKTYNMEDFGFTLEKCFSSPTKALEEIVQIRPDLIITDIRMPRMTGLEFAKKAKELLPDVEIVIMSGYDDFSYAQAAVKIGVQDYLLKPVKKDEYSSMLRRVHDRIEEKKTQKEDFHDLRKAVQDSQNEIKNYFFLDLVDDIYTGSARIQKIYDNLAFDFKDAPFVLIKFDYSNASFVDDPMSTLGRITDEVYTELESFGNVEDFSSDEYLFFFLYHVEEALSDAIRETVLDYAERHRTHGLNLYAGISDIHTGLEELFAANAECNRQIWANHIHLDDSQDAFLDLRKNHLNIPYGDLEELFRSIAAGDKQAIDSTLRNIYAIPRKLQSPLAENYSYTLTYLILLRMYQVQTTFTNDTMFIPIELQQIKNLRSLYPTIDDQNQLTKQLSLSIIDHLSNQTSEHSSAPSKNVARVLDYVSEHYKENISLAKTAQAVALSKSYLSDIFKKEIGITFLNYVTNLRIEKAKELLLDSTMKMYEISDAVGFQDYTYFSQIFKKKTGMTLSEYRNRH
ncbi:helix-turn-helix domain-containing protein [Eubacterium oxidoreducens]|uniref:Stage 0 sporulation protein A homolog n=1 Tax=Eubacterium oxidoreducens TaxID=1732 RepID=A0A1G6ADX6_EUBOX|nr:helix-turn-helix domain-containing protein [Eubacterium oxidoreducens]SDB06634.1 two-component system, response regulator YesN [Eubacterium oxidoreducens]